MNPELISQSGAAYRIARAFERSQHCYVQVREQRAFKKNHWLCLGSIAMWLNSLDTSGGGGHQDAMLATTAFEWRLPDARQVESELAVLLDVNKSEDDYTKVLRALDQTASIAARAGLLHPRFDPDAIEEMPYRRGTTVVSDTSGVLQGGLDFVVRYLHPAARMKVPAFVQMEFVNFTDRFFKFRRRNKVRVSKNGGRKIHRADELIEHMKSQGGQRALLRLELQMDTELERTYPLGDPLRYVFQKEGGSAVNDLNINISVPSYADRLILEAARYHQAQSEPGHAVRLLTSDQGLALMALGEGMTPLYFSAMNRHDFFGRRFTGQFLDPFSGDVCGVSLAAVLWELATAFGAVRLRWKDGSGIMLFARNEATPWSLFHSVDDLLWFSASEASNSTALTSHSNRAVPEQPNQIEDRDDMVAVPHGDIADVSFYRMNIDRLFRLICTLDDLEFLDAAAVSGVLNIRLRSTGDYKRFLLSSGFLEVDGSRWKALPPVRTLAVSLRDGDIGAMYRALLQSPSFAMYHAQIEESPVGKIVEMLKLSRGATTYRILGELTLICASVGSDVYATRERPSVELFSQIAVKRFNELDRGNGLVASGRWLESLIRHDGIHPEVARRLLEQANREGFLRRSTEGSTMQTGFDSHVVHVLRKDSAGMPVAAPAHLYRGDYLIPGKASVSLRIEGRP